MKGLKELEESHLKSIIIFAYCLRQPVAHFSVDLVDRNLYHCTGISLSFPMVLRSEEQKKFFK